MTNPEPGSAMTSESEALPQEEESEEGEAPSPAIPTFDGCNLTAHYRMALECMAYEGASLHVAAQKHGIRTDNFIKAFNRPHVRKRYNAIVSAIRDGAAVQAYLRIQQRAQFSSSEPVRQRADEWIAGVDGLAPLKRVESKHSHSHTFGGFDYGGITIEGSVSPDNQSAGTDDEKPYE